LTATNTAIVVAVVVVALDRMGHMVILVDFLSNMCWVLQSLILFYFFLFIDILLLANCVYYMEVSVLTIITVEYKIRKYMGH